METYYKNGGSTLYNPSRIDSITMDILSVEPSALLSNEGQMESSGYMGVFSFSIPTVYDSDGKRMDGNIILGDPATYSVIRTEYDEAGQLLRASEVASGLFDLFSDMKADFDSAPSGERCLQISLTLPSEVVLDQVNYSYTVLVSFPQGFVRDKLSGVGSEAVVSSFNGGVVEGAYWRVEQVKPVEPVGVLKEGGYVWLYDSTFAEEQSGEQPNYPGYIGGEVSLRACTPEPFEGMDGVMYSVDYLLDGLLSIVFDLPQENLYATPVASNADGTFSVLSGALMASGLELNNGGTGFDRSLRLQT